jgi:phosphatidylglycerol:prolipoprotein diacylglycerol transferase
MIDPVIFTIRIGNLAFPLRWYGVIVMIGVIVGSLIVERELRRRGENGERIWDALIWILPAGIIGARLWYVINATLGGNRYYTDNPIQIFNIPQGGLHIFGGLLLGAAVLLYYLRQNKLDAWLFLDAAGPAMLIGQAIGRIANFINQELYGPPTTLPWGIPISAEHRLPQFANLPESTRFHPTFAYEMLWNLFAASLLLWLSRRYEKQFKPGALFAGWLIMAGVGRVFIEFFRPDQPQIGDLGFSYSSLVFALMAIAGVILLMARYKVIQPKFAENWEEEYKPSSAVGQVAGKPTSSNVQDDPTMKESVIKEAVVPVKKKTSTPKPKSTVTKKAAPKKSAPKVEEETPARPKRAKKSTE